MSTDGDNALTLDAVADRYRVRLAGPLLRDPDLSPGGDTETPVVSLASVGVAYFRCSFAVARLLKRKCAARCGN